MKVHELTKELNISRKDLENIVSDMGIKITGNFQKLDDETVQKVKTKIGSPGGDSKNKTNNKTKTPAKPVEDKEETIEKEEAVAPEEPEETKPSLKLKRGATVKDLAEALDVSATEVIKKLMLMGEMATINQTVSEDALSLMGDDYGYVIETESDLAEFEEHEEKGTPEPRPPVVTVMGHVDHGKTSLLDAIRRTDVVTGEAGGITQHIGAYQVTHNSHTLTFLDTPGHEAFTAMRARGAKATDIAVLVVAADDGVKAQTVEAIDHAKAAEVPVVVAINKMDKPEANPDRVKKELSDLGLVPEEWGGDTVMVEVSAKAQTGLDNLLDMIHLVSEVMEIKAPRDVPARGVVIEAQLDKSRGPVASTLIQRGILNVGQVLIAGDTMGRVRAMFDDKGRPIRTAFPGQPVEILGISVLPQAGDVFRVVPDEKTARQIIADREAMSQKRAFVTAAEAMERMQAVKAEELRVVIKADVQGSLEALKSALNKLSTEAVKVNILHSGVGAISETDVMLASASNAFIIAFQVRPEPKARDMAEREKVEIRTHRVIYQVVDDVRAAALGLRKPQIEEEETGRVEVRQVFKVPKIGQVAGSYVLDGEINRGSLVRVVRDGVVVHEGKIESLRRFKDDVASVKSGFECGVTVENYRDIKEGDILEVYKLIEVPHLTL